MQIIINLFEVRERMEWLSAYAAEGIAAARPPEEKAETIHRLVVDKDDAALISVLESQAIGRLGLVLSNRRTVVARMGSDRIKIRTLRAVDSSNTAAELATEAVINFLSRDITRRWFRLRSELPVSEEVMEILQSDCSEEDSILISSFPSAAGKCRRAISPF
ncbi:MAG: hypothetical protein NC328_06000 [Muribaculum sp.]|nr:hypothetical protein [Muribaculum sp.]